MAESIVQDWLAEYESLGELEVSTFVNMQDNNPDITDAIHSIFINRVKYPELIHGVCNQLYKFYISKEDGLRKFSLQFIPILIYVYLNAVCLGDKTNCRSIETLLISMYNVEVSNEDGSEKIVSFRMPVLAQASIYHDEKCLNAIDLRRYEENCNRDVKWGPFPQVESINTSNRMKVMTALLFFYNQQLCKLQKTALLHLCRVASQMVNQGFSSQMRSDQIPVNFAYVSPVTGKHIIPRIPLSSGFLLELAHAIYFAMFNDFGTVAIQTMDDIHYRGTFEMYTDLILVTNAVRNSLHQNPSGQPSDGPMGLSVALTPATNTAPTVSKSMITNASFRTKKLPDDLDMDFLSTLPPSLTESRIQEMNEQLHPPHTIIIDDEQRNSTILSTFSKRWKPWGNWKYSPGGSKTSSIDEELDSPKKSLPTTTSSKNSSPTMSLKTKKSQLKAEEVLANLSAATVRRRKSPSPGNKSPDVRASAGARLILDDSCDDSADEKDALLDDIPIQDADKPLTSITEEPDQPHQVGQRNTAIRSSKEGIKAQAHKALSNFKKSKDKEKESKNTPNKSDVNIIHGHKEQPPKPPSRKISAAGIRAALLHENISNEVIIPLQPITNGSKNKHTTAAVDSNNSDFENSSFDTTDSPNMSIEIPNLNNLTMDTNAHHLQSQV